MINIKRKAAQEVIDAFKAARETVSAKIVLRFPLSDETKEHMKTLEELDAKIAWLESDKGNVQGGPVFEFEELIDLGIIEDPKKTSDPASTVDPRSIATEWQDKHHTDKKEILSSKPIEEIKSVKEEWVKKHTLKTPWRNQIEVSQREYQIDKRAEELLRMSGLYAAALKTCRDYARIELMYKELHKLHNPPIDFDEQEEIDYQESVKLAEALKTTNNGQRLDPAI